MKKWYLACALLLIVSSASAETYVTGTSFSPPSPVDDLDTDLYLYIYLPNDCWFTAAEADNAAQKIYLAILDRSEQLPNCSNYSTSTSEHLHLGLLQAGHYEYTVEESHNSGTDPWTGSWTISFDVAHTVPDAVDSWGTIKSRYR